MEQKNHELSQSETVEQVPAACADEYAALDFLERERWGGTPCCLHCGDVNVYTITDKKTKARRLDGRWRCRGCGKQYTVRVGTVMEDSPIPLRKWVYAFWCAASAKNGVSALEMSRKVQVTYKSALYMMNRIRWAMNRTEPPKLKGVVEADETFVGGKPRGLSRGWSKQNLIQPRARRSSKTPVFAVVQRGGDVRTRVIASVTTHNLRQALRDHVDPSATLYTDEGHGYKAPGKEFAAHAYVKHSVKEYARGPVNTNSVESFFARVKRQIGGTYHNVSKEHLHRYVTHAEYLYNCRKMNDGERIGHLIKSANGKRLFYRAPERKAG